MDTHWATPLFHDLAYPAAGTCWQKRSCDTRKESVSRLQDSKPRGSAAPGPGTGRQHRVFQPRCAVLGVSLICKNNPGAREEANVERVALCKTEINVLIWTPDSFAPPIAQVGGSEAIFEAWRFQLCFFVYSLTYNHLWLSLIYSVSEQELTHLMLINSAGLGKWLPCGYPVLLWIIVPPGYVLHLRSKTQDVLGMKTWDSANRLAKIHTKKCIPASLSCAPENWRGQHNTKPLLYKKQ